MSRRDQDAIARAKQILRAKVNRVRIERRELIKDVVEKYLDCGNPRSGFALMIPSHEDRPKRSPGSAVRAAGLNIF